VVALVCVCAGAVFVFSAEGWTLGADGGRVAATAVGNPAFDPAAVSFISSSEGWAWGPSTAGVGSINAEPGVLAQTDDGGRSWRVELTTGIGYSDDAGTDLWGVRFADAEHGYLFGSKLFVTASGGARWTRVDAPGAIVGMQAGGGRVYALVSGCSNLSVCNSDSARLYWLAPGGTRLHRIDAIVNVDRDWWSLVVTGQSVYLMTPSPARGAQLGPASLWASHDGGSTWRQLTAPCVWSGADGGALAAWSPVGLALACGSVPGAGSQAKSFYASSDGGAHWHKIGQMPFGGGYVISLAAASSTNWILGEARVPHIETTRDGGHDWQQATFTGRTSGVEGWGDVVFTSPSNAIALPWTLNGSVIAFSHDTGRSWQEALFPTSRLTPTKP